MISPRFTVALGLCPMIQRTDVFTRTCKELVKRSLLWVPEKENRSCARNSKNEIWMMRSKSHSSKPSSSFHANLSSCSTELQHWSQTAAGSDQKESYRKWHQKYCSKQSISQVVQKESFRARIAFSYKFSGTWKPLGSSTPDFRIIWQNLRDTSTVAKGDAGIVESIAAPENSTLSLRPASSF